MATILVKNNKVNSRVLNYNNYTSYSILKKTRLFKMPTLKMIRVGDNKVVNGGGDKKLELILFSRIGLN